MKDVLFNLEKDKLRLEFQPVIRGGESPLITTSTLQLLLIEFVILSSDGN